VIALAPALLALSLGGCSLIEPTPATREAVCQVILECANRCGDRGSACLGLPEGYYTCACDGDAACNHNICSGEAGARLVRGDAAPP
jgi:hypothetical protein